MQQVAGNAQYECHCCGSKDTQYVQHYVLRRSLAVAPMYLCASCQSLSVDHDAVRRHYPRSNSKEAIEFHRRIRPRNEKWAATLLDAFKRHGGNFSTLIDIGCGSGTLLSVAANQGMKAIGYEVDPLALAEARVDTRLEINDQFFTKSSQGHRNAVVCCIAVLEHLYRPSALMGEIAEYCKRNCAAAFIFVPCLPSNWRNYLGESVHAPGNPFFDNEEHISHYSEPALLDDWIGHFQVEPKVLTAGGWRGFYCGPRGQ